MKNIIFVTDFDPKGSGYKNIAVPLLNLMVKDGHNVIVLGSHYTLMSENLYPFHLIPVMDTKDCARHIKRLERDLPIDVVIVAADLLYHRRYLDTFEQAQIQTEVVAIFPIESPPMTFSWMLPMLACKKMFCYSKFGTQTCNDLGFEVEYLPVGIDRVLWKNYLDKSKVYKEYGKQPKDFIILTVADNQERKNLTASMDIVQKVQNKCRHLRVWYYLVTRENNIMGYALRDYANEIGLKDFEIIERGMAEERLCDIYNVADLFLLTSKAEGLGLPVLEAMSCFTGDTRVWAESPEKGIENTYTGELLTITLKNGKKIKTTPDHPFWTDSGWQYAKDLDLDSLLLYNNEKIYTGDYCAKEERQNIFRGRIKNITETLSKVSSKTNSRDYEKTPEANKLANISVGNQKDNRGKYTLSFLGQLIRKRFGIFSWNYRRGGDCNYKENGGQKENKLEANNSNFKYIRDTKKLDFKDAKQPIYLDFNKRWYKDEYGRLLHILYIRTKSAIFVQKTIALFKNKESTHGNPYRVYQSEIKTINSRPTYAPPKASYLKDTRSKYKAIAKIQSKYVTKIKVYNLKTRDGVYYANGVLVHNCGVPVAGTDVCAIAEHLQEGKNGIPLPIKFKNRDMYNNGWRYFVDEDESSDLIVKWIRERKNYQPEVEKYLLDRTFELSYNTLMRGIFGEENE
jgi:glycosyltransferase involved in cell wall biosynthesis